MNKIIQKSMLLWISVLVSLSTTQAASAKGPPAKITIEGPGLKGPIEIADTDILTAFSLFQFEDVNRPLEAPENLGAGYTITRHVLDGEKMILWDRLIYYPGTAGEAGVVYLEGLIGTSSTEFDGKWYPASADGDAAMREILTAAGVTLAKGEPLKSGSVPSSAASDRGSLAPPQPSGPQSSAFPAPSFGLPLLLGLAALGLAAVAALLYRRRRAVA